MTLFSLGCSVPDAAASSASFLGFFLGFQLILFSLRRCFFFSGVSIGSIFLHQSQKVGFVHKVHKVDGLLPLGVAVNDQIECVAPDFDTSVMNCCPLPSE